MLHVCINAYMLHECIQLTVGLCVQVMCCSMQRVAPGSFLFHCSALACPMEQSGVMLRAARSLVNLERGRSGKMDNAAPLVKRQNLLDNHFIKINYYY